MATAVPAAAASDTTPNTGVSVSAQASPLGALYKGFTLTNDDAEISTTVTVVLTALAGGSGLTTGLAQTAAASNVNGVTQPLFAGLQSNTDSSGGASASSNGDWQTGWSGVTQLGAGSVGGTSYQARAQRTKTVVITMPPGSSWFSGVLGNLTIFGNPQVVATITVNNEITVLVDTAILDTFV